MPRVLPRSSWKERPSTALTRPSSVGKWTVQVAHVEEGVRPARPTVGSSLERLVAAHCSSARVSDEPHSRVDHGVEQVHDEVGDDDEDRREQRDAEDDGQVLGS